MTNNRRAELLSYTASVRPVARSSSYQTAGLEGRYVPVSETIQGFKEILEGKYDDIPESYFLNCGSIDDVLAKVK